MDVLRKEMLNRQKNPPSKPEKTKKKVAKAPKEKPAKKKPYPKTKRVKKQVTSPSLHTPFVIFPQWVLMHDTQAKPAKARRVKGTTKIPGMSLADALRGMTSGSSLGDLEMLDPMLAVIERMSCYYLVSKPFRSSTNREDSNYGRQPAPSL
jgi:hypothetical protein